MTNDQHEKPETRATDRSDDGLWTCRNVAEYAYCPRLFYYMAVEGVFIPSHDTEEGARVHKRVDRPSAAPAGPDTDGDSDPDRPYTVRSLALTSERLGLTGKLDLAEIDDRTAIPVEYRKGRPNRYARREVVDEMMEEATPTDQPEPWPTDRVQVGLQAILLEEAGYEVHEAVLYYAEEKLRLRIEVDDRLKQEALQALDDARRAAEGPRPAPLVNDPRCPRCSLLPICLPDEVNHQRVSASGGDGAPSDDDATGLLAPRPRRMWPPRDDGVHVVLQREGIHVGVRGQSVRITGKDKRVVREMPLANMESLALLGGVQVSTQALTTFADKEVPVAFMSAAGRLVAMMDPMGPTSAAVRAAQVRVLDDPEKALELAKAVVVAKINNQRTLLMRNHEGLPKYVAREMLDAVKGAERARSMAELRGHEGNGAAIYFRHFGGMLKGGAGALADEFDENGRMRRPPPDPINAVLSFGYAILTNECVSACRLASLEPTLGALHTTRPGRPAMALDLMEPFRPLIADSVAVSAFNRGELGEGHFVRTAAGCALTEYGRTGFFGAYARRMATEVAHPVFDYRLSYRRMLMLHARLISAWLLGDVPTLAFLTTR